MAVVVVLGVMEGEVVGVCDGEGLAEGDLELEGEGEVEGVTDGVGVAEGGMGTSVPHAALDFAKTV